VGHGSATSTPKAGTFIAAKHPLSYASPLIAHDVAGIIIGTEIAPDIEGLYPFDFFSELFLGYHLSGAAHHFNLHQAQSAKRLSGSA
jgi:hypothetical protein